MVTRLVFIITLFLFLPLSASARENRTVVDHLGRTVSIPAKVQRIVPLGGAARYVVYLQAFDLVVGVEAMESRVPPTSGRPYNLAIREKAAKLPVVGEGRQKPVNHEAIAALKPDLILTAEGDREQADRLSRLTNCPVIVIDYGGIGVLSLDRFRQTINLLGNLLDREKRAGQLLKYIESNNAEFGRRITAPSSETVYIGAVSFRGAHGMTSTDPLYYPLVMARGRNLAAGTGKNAHIFIDMEQLLVWNPSVIFIDAAGLKLAREEFSRQKTFYSRLSAFKNSRLYLTMPYNNYHTNLELAIANGWFVAKVLYPERFREISPEKKTDEICRVFTGAACYAQLKKEFGGFGRLSPVDLGIHAE